MNTETTKINTRVFNTQFLNMVNGGQVKQAEDTSNSFIRNLILQEAAVREVMEPEGLSDEDIDRVSTSDRPMKIVEKEPGDEETYATWVELTGTPEAHWIKGSRYEVYFGKITTPTYFKSKWELMTYQMDIRKVIADNSVKKMGDEEDKYFRRTLLTIVNKQSTVQRTGASSFTSNAFKRAFQAMDDRRRPIGKLLLTKRLFREAMDLPATALGNDIASKHYREGIDGEDHLYGVPAVVTSKVHIYDKKECWVLAPNEFLGRFYLLQDATMFIEQKRDVIGFDSYSAPGIGIGNFESIQHLVFQ